ncbi:DUF4397 domain-containing protein [Hymenobacter cellulosivorans]|uniref:DUF4397 domain-containing protein n=1 Tax=Hymenobacter cellulosivorans TaxID=2932249 RepID=A0ABY4FA53_9BACT|nr:DUF4397 domain-containing protein [Hymenobacter cellulosivorans]UOQ53383.1 DUF4397 domain-containing protein [Hymenobacter cellulosivorans]
MKTSLNILQRRFIWAVIPAALAFTGCGDDEDSATPAPEQGRVVVVNGAAGINVPVKVLAGDAEKASLAYGQNSSYTNLNTGDQIFKVNVASSGQNVVTQPSYKIENNKSYSYFLYTPSATVNGAGLIAPDDLTAPAANKAKIRLVNLALATTGPLRLSQQLAVGYSDIIPDVAFPGVSNFIEINPGPLNLAVSAGNPSLPVYQVGDGSGTGTGTKTYEAGKIYTVVVRGDANNLDPERKPRAVLMQNN